MSEKIGMVLGTLVILVPLLLWRWHLCDGEIACYLSQQVFILNKE